MTTPYQEATARAAARRSRRASRVQDNAAISVEIGQMTQKEAANCVKKNGKRGKKKKSPSLSKLKKELWKLISKVVRSWSEVCVVPGCRESVQCACHIVPANDGAATRFFLPNLYPGCFSHNESERRQRGSWVYRHREMFGADFVDALYAMSDSTFQVKKHWVLEQTERMRKLLEAS